VDLVAAPGWVQPLAPVHSVGVSALVATIPLAVVLVLMGVARRSSLVAGACGLLATAVLAVTVWRMPPALAGWSLLFGCVTAAWSILWLVFNALWLYNLAVRVGSFDRLRRWIEQHASGDPCVQAVLVAFCFGALLEGSAGFGAPVAITSFLLVGLGFEPRRAVLVSLLSNTAPVAFGSVGVPIVALASVTGLDLMKLAAAVGRQLPLLSVLLPSYLAIVVAGRAGLRRTWPVALVAGASFAGAQFVVSNTWGPYVADVLSALVSITATTMLLRVWSPRAALAAGATATTDAAMSRATMTGRDVLAGVVPWLLLSLVIVAWSHAKLFSVGQVAMPIPQLHNGVVIALYQRPYAAVFNFQPLVSGTAVLVTVILTALWFRMAPGAVLQCAIETLRQLRLPAAAVLCIVGMAFLFNYSGMVYTLGAALAGTGVLFPVVSSFLGWVACFLTGSDTSSNFLFGNLQVATAQQLHLNPILTAATNSSGAVAGKMISPQNIAIGVSTVGLVGREGEVLRSTFWHSVVFAAFIGVIAWAQAYLVPWMVPR
jgi:lactate permease